MTNKKSSISYSNSMNRSMKIISPFLYFKNGRKLEVKPSTIYKQIRDEKINVKQLNKVLLDNYDNLIYNPSTGRIVKKSTFNKAFKSGKIDYDKFLDTLPNDKIMNPVSLRIINKNKKNTKNVEEKIDNYEKKYKNFLFEDIDEKVQKKLKDKNKSFTLNLRSAISNAKRKITFNNYWHFKNFYDNIVMDKGKDSEDTGTAYDDIKTNKDDIFKYVNFKITSGGGYDTNGNRFRKLKSCYYDFEVYSPYDKNNNCGFKCISYITNQEINCIDERKEIGIEANTLLTVEQLVLCAKKYGVDVVVIEKDIKDELDVNKKYIILHKNHYFVVDKFQYKHHKDEKTKRGWLYWDIETRNDYSQEVYIGSTKGYKLIDVILVAHYKKYKSEEYQKIVFTTNREETCSRQFLNWLSEMAEDGKYFNCIAHNCSRFDNFFLLNQLTEQETEFTDIHFRGNSVIGIEYKSNLFKDSCCFLTNSLDNLCRSFKIKCPKLKEFQYNGKTLSNMELCFYKHELDVFEFIELAEKEPEFWKLYIEYCYVDCVSLSEIWEKFTTECNNIITKMDVKLLMKCNSMSCNTIGALSMKMLNGLNNGRYHFKEMNKFIDDQDKYNFMCNFKRGGISHCNQKGKHEKPTISFDITSQYPASCINMKIPIGESRFVNTYQGNGFYHLKNLKFDTKYRFKPIARKNENNILEWLTDDIDEIYLDSEMIEYVKKYYGLKSFDVIKGLVSDTNIEGKKLFAKYVDVLFKSKAEQDVYKTSGDDKYNPALREVIKLFLNSVTGKLVEDTTKYFKYEWGESEGEVKQLNGIHIYKVKSKERLNTWLTCGVMVYSYSKRLLFEYVRCLPDNSNNVIHVETDSMYFHKEHEKIFRENLKNYKGDYPVCIGDSLGSVKVEKDTGESSYFLAKKFYYIEGNCIIKGIPKTTIDEQGSTVNLVDKSLYEDVYNWRKGDKQITREFSTMRKTLWGSSTTIEAFRLSRTINSTPEEYKLYD